MLQATENIKVGEVCDDFRLRVGVTAPRRFLYRGRVASLCLKHNGSALTSGGFSESANCSAVVPGQSWSIQVGNISSLLGLHAGVIAINDNATNAPQLVPLRARFVDCSKKTARCDNLTPTAEVNCQ